METLKQKTARGLFWGGMNTMVQQVIGLLFGIILGRLLAPSDYGMMAIISVFSLVSVALQDSGFKVALANEKAPRRPVTPPPARARGWRGAIRGFFYPFIFAWHCSQFDME